MDKHTAITTLIKTACDRSLWWPGSQHQLAAVVIADQLQELIPSATLAECQCAGLNRQKHPFRTEACFTIYDETIATFPPSTYPAITYCAIHPGGFFFDWQLITLLAQSYQHIRIIAIEPYAGQQIQQAYATMDQWCQLLSETYDQLTITIEQLDTWQDYNQIAETPHVITAIDPELPFPAIADNEGLYVSDAHPTLSYYLKGYEEYAHFITGYQPYSDVHWYRHWYGDRSLFQHRQNYLFYHNAAIMPFGDMAIQWDGTVYTTEVQQIHAALTEARIPNLDTISALKDS